MAYARYNVIEGEVMSFEQNGVRRDLFPDPQGSVAYHITNFHLTSASTTYWPYGRIRSRTGSVDIPFLYLGTYGYYRDMKSFNDLVYGRYYVRARFYSQNLGQWTTQDPLWPQEHAYQYVNGNPINRIDPSGMSCYWNKLLSGVAPYWACYNCMTKEKKYSISYAYQRCKRLSLTPLNPHIIEVLHEVEGDCVGESDPAICCTFIGAGWVGQMLTMAGGGFSDLPSSEKACACIKKCEDAIFNEMEIRKISKIDMGSALKGFHSCLQNPNKPGGLDIARAILEGIVQLP